MKIMRPRKSWTVLDMGCGGGTIAIPLARKVKSVTAVDDVAIASRSLSGDNVKDGLDKLHKAARKAVYISTVVGSGPVDVRLYESTGRKFKPEQDYICYYNLLYEMGIRANVTFLLERHRNQWDSPEDALDGQRWMFRGMTEDDEEGVRTYLKQHLVHAFGHWRLPYTRSCYWAVMWWTKDKEGKNDVM
jgi:SAM-dependent methyltransferase